MKNTTCIWKGCHKTIQVDNHIEKTTPFTVCGWCDLHHEAYRIYRNLELKFMKRNRIDYMTSTDFKKHKKALNQLNELAVIRAKTTLEEKSL